MASQVSKLSNRSPLSSEVSVETTGSPSVFSRWYYVGTQFAAGVIFFSSALLVWVFGFTFWTLLEALVRAFHGHAGHSILAPFFALFTRQRGILTIADGWPLDVAFVLALLSTWCCLYLAFDHLILWGNVAARQTFKQRHATESTPRFFVEFRSVHKPTPLQPDLGFLRLTPTALVFEGERQRITLPRHAIGNTVVLRRSFFDLAASYVYLPLSDGHTTLQLLARDNANRLSETIHDARSLESAIREWLASTPPSREEILPV